MHVTFVIISHANSPRLQFLCMTYAGHVIQRYNEHQLTSNHSIQILYIYAGLLYRLSLTQLCNIQCMVDRDLLLMAS